MSNPQAGDRAASAPSAASAPAAAAAAAAAADEHSYTVAELSIQPDGDAFLVGSTALGGFYQFPAEGVAILERLREGQSPAAIKAVLAADATNSADARAAGGAPASLGVPASVGTPAAEGDDQPLDVDDFVATLVDIGFVRMTDATPRPAPAVARDRRWLFSVDRQVAGLFFSPLAFAGYAALILAAVVCAVRDPAARPNLHAFFIDDHLAATLVLLLFVSSFTTGLHELGHLLAAAREGVASRLGIGTRLWNIVIEADLSGIFALPKRRRYVPLLAGMIVDTLTIAAVTLIIAGLARSGQHPFLVALLQALILQTLITISWQFNIFLRTDVYYVLSTWASYPNLDADARAYLSGKLHLLSGGLYRRADRPAPRDRLGMLRAFAIVWVVGRVLSLATLFLVVLPTLARYAVRAWRAFNDPAASGALQIDTAIFALVSILLVGTGLVLWLRPKFRQVTRRRVRMLEE